jgi:hypothetical protein
VPTVFEFSPFDLARLHRQARRDALQAWMPVISSTEIVP